MHKIQQTWVRSLAWENPLEEEMATRSSILAWRIPQRRLAGYSPKEHKESDTNEHTHMRFLSHIYNTHMINLSESSNAFYMNPKHSLSHHAHRSNSQLTNRNNQYNKINIMYYWIAFKRDHISIIRKGQVTRILKPNNKTKTSST